MMKPLYTFLGFLFVGIGLVGVVVPGLPTTPFLLVAMFFFGKASQRLRDWFLSTPIYHKYLKDYDQKRAMTAKQKASILLFSAPFCLFAFFALPNIWGKVAIVLAVIVQYYYFFFKIKTLENPASNVE